MHTTLDRFPFMKTEEIAVYRTMVMRLLMVMVGSDDASFTLLTVDD